MWCVGGGLVSAASTCLMLAPIGQTFDELKEQCATSVEIDTHLPHLLVWKIAWGGADIRPM